MVAGVVVAGVGFKAWVKPKAVLFSGTVPDLKCLCLATSWPSLPLRALRARQGHCLNRALILSTHLLLRVMFPAIDTSATSCSGPLADVRHGKPLAVALAGAPVIPSLLREMIALGEESGQVGPMMKRVAEVYDRQTRETVSGITQS